MGIVRELWGNRHDSMEEVLCHHSRDVKRHSRH